MPVAGVAAVRGGPANILAIRSEFQRQLIEIGLEMALCVGGVESNSWLVMVEREDVVWIGSPKHQITDTCISYIEKTARCLILSSL